ncbi:Hsp33 family molecular chaperone HslO [Croceicoccus naphthovorans]|uniref:Molecular chaperone Hsp33 n=1 Tax=Croceicoccus naphthovorans TaxID=1348774 RepID=A0A0G3XF86_9SPHN|nr:Hsp33 family molecular chaperone HslO [Croceicoccus naphthovorans]AKM09274.1 molecular chaperone Hsp33 [Croceicoccus naphthovorans]MBB3990173.1 molecular chaperone Hsp33 [Croceicoccus naphthovorans]
MPEAIGETGFDRVLSFTIPDRDARGRCVRLGPTLDTILSAHEYPAAVRNLLSEALVLCTLMGSLVKDEGQLTMQAQSNAGPIELLVCDYRGGELRGYVRHNTERVEGLGANPQLGALFGEDAFLAVTFDLSVTGQRYQGIVPFDGATLSEACEHYFRQSEQVPSILRVAISSDGPHTIAGGMLIQHLPDGEEGRERLHVRYDDPDWEHVAVMGGSVRHGELIDPSLTLEAMLWRLFHEEDELRVAQGEPVFRGCRCSVEHYREVLSRFSENDRLEMRQPDGLVHVDCAFCSKVFELDM